MVFHKEKKLCLLLPPKNGTQTSRLFLLENGWNAVGPHHIDVGTAIQMYPNLKNYQIYSFIRNPLDRFISCILYFKQHQLLKNKIESVIEENNLQTTVKDISYEMLLPYIDKLDENYKVMFRPQYMMFRAQNLYFTQPNVEALDFDNFETELRRISGLLDPDKYPITTLHKSSDWGKSVITDKVREFVRERYADDYVLAKERLGKEYV